jgi:hypothetical protein
VEGKLVVLLRQLFARNKVVDVILEFIHSTGIGSVDLFMGILVEFGDLLFADA